MTHYDPYLSGYVQHVRHLTGPKHKAKVEKVVLELAVQPVFRRRYDAYQEVLGARGERERSQAGLGKTREGWSGRGDLGEVSTLKGGSEIPRGPRRSVRISTQRTHNTFPLLIANSLT